MKKIKNKSINCICPYCKQKIFMNISIHLTEHPCLEYLKQCEKDHKVKKNLNAW